MTAEESRDMLLRALEAEERLFDASRKLRRIKHLVRTYQDVCDAGKDPHAARIMAAVWAVVEEGT